MDEGRHTFLRREKPTCMLSQNALNRIICRGLGQEMRMEISYKPILPLVNSEAHILCSDVDVSSRHVAFGRWAIPKLKRELLSSDPLISKRALLSLLDMVHDPEKAVEAIRLQVIPRLVRLLASEDCFVRQHTLMVLEVLAMQPHGKIAIVNHDLIMKSLTTLISDINDNVRLAAARAVLSLARWYFGVEKMIEKNFIVSLIQQISKELDTNITATLLEALEFLLDQDMAAKQQALENEGVELATLLEHSDARIRAGTTAVIAQLTKHPEGKKAVLGYETDMLKTLTTLLEDDDLTVRTQAAAALMFVMCTTEAKLRCLKLQTPQVLIGCAQATKQPGLQVNAIKALTSFAESPTGQSILKKNLKLIKHIQPADSVVQRHKKILITVINRVI